MEAYKRNLITEFTSHIMFLGAGIYQISAFNTSIQSHLYCINFTAYCVYHSMPFDQCTIVSILVVTATKANKLKVQCKHMLKFALQNYTHLSIIMTHSLNVTMNISTHVPYTVTSLSIKALSWSCFHVMAADTGVPTFGSITVYPVLFTVKS